MLIWLQILGIVFALVMVYVTLLFYRRHEIRFTDLLIWSPIWFLFLFGVLFPRSLDVFVQTFSVRNAVELFTIAGFMFMIALQFFLFRLVRLQQNKLRKIVKVTALREVK